MRGSNQKTSPCEVCDNPNSRKSYNVNVCNACRVFFSRYYSKHLIFCCEAAGNCEISYQNQRLNCAACRLKKCFDINMSRAGRDRRKGVVNPLYMSHVSSAPMKKLLEMYGDIMNNGFKIIGSLKNFHRVTDWINCLVYFESRLLSPGGTSPSSVTADTTISLNDLLMFPGACIDRSTRAIDVFSNSRTASSSPIPFKLMETVLRIIVAAIENMALVEEFHLLPVVDKIKLVQQNSLMMSVSILAYIKYSQGFDPQSCARYLERFTLASGVDSVWKSAVAMWTSSSVARLDEMMREIQPTEKEMMLLRIRSFFRPYHSEEGHSIVLRARMKLASCLGEYIRETYPSFTQRQVLNRVYQILQLESLLQNPVAEFNNTLLTLTSQGANGFGTPLSHDIFIRTV